MIRNFCALALACFLVLSVSGCEEEGKAEKAGKEIDQAIEQTEKKVGETLDIMKKKIEEAKE